MKKLISNFIVHIIIIIVILIISFILPPFSHLHSSTVIKLSFSDLVKESDAVVVGVVVNKEYETSGNLVLTKNIAEIEECISGWDKLKESTIEIVTLGGKKNGISVHVFGEARFNIGERFIAFLRIRGGRWRVIGMAQGKMTVKVDEKTGIELVYPPDKVNLVKQKGGKLVKAHPYLTSPVPLSEFIDSIIWEIDKNEP